MNGGRLAYQQVPYVMLRPGESAARVLDDDERAAWMESYLAGDLQYEGGRVRLQV